MPKRFNPKTIEKRIATDVDDVCGNYDLRELLETVQGRLEAVRGSQPARGGRTRHGQDEHPHQPPADPVARLRNWGTRRRT